MLTKKEAVILESAVEALLLSFRKMKRSRGERRQVFFKEVKSRSRRVYTLMHKMETSKNESGKG